MSVMTEKDLFTFAEEGDEPEETKI